MFVNSDRSACRWQHQRAAYRAPSGSALLPPRALAIGHDNWAGCIQHYIYLNSTKANHFLQALHYSLHSSTVGRKCPQNAGALVQDACRETELLCRMRRSSALLRKQRQTSRC
jgi:hypothetical protein